MNTTALILDEMRPAEAYQAGYLEGLRESEEREANWNSLAATGCGRTLEGILDRIDLVEPKPHLPASWTRLPFDVAA